MRGVIYAIGNKVNGKIYIGKSATLTAERRWKYHLWDAVRGKPWPLHKAIRKYGAESFVIMTLHSRIRTEERLNLLERRYIRKYESNDSEKGYNLTEGGDGTPGFKPSPTQRLRLSLSKMGNKNSPRGRKQPPSQLEKRRVAMLGNTNGRGNKGKKKSLADRRHHSRMMKKVWSKERGSRRGQSLRRERCNTRSHSRS